MKLKLWSMTNKQMVIEYLDPYRSKVLSSVTSYADLLRALEDIDGQQTLNVHLDFSAKWIKKYHLRVTIPKGHPRLNVNADIPLSYRYIEEIPEDDRVWGELAKIFN